MSKKVKVPTLRACLHAKRKELVSFLDKISSYKSELFWFKKAKIANAVTLVAHIDTVHKETDRLWDYKTQKYIDVKMQRRIFFDRQQQVFSSPDGLGADDRAGVWGLLRVYASLPDELKPNLLFCDEEESGAAGARAAARLLKEIKDSLFLIELDRKNHQDCVFYNNEPDPFIKYIEGFGFEKAWGSFSDVSHLGKEFELCSTNLSVGFYNEHTRWETLYCQILNNTIEKTINIVADANKAQRRWELPKKVEIKKAKGWSRYDSLFGEGEFYTEEELNRYPYLKELYERRKAFLC